MKNYKIKFMLSSIMLTALSAHAVEGEAFKSTKDLFEDYSESWHSIKHSTDYGIASPIALASGLTLSAVGLASALPVDLISLPADLYDTKVRLRAQKECAIEAITKLQMITAGLVGPEETSANMQYILQFIVINLGRNRVIEEISPMIKNSKEKIIKELKAQGKKEEEIKRMTSFIDKDPKEMDRDELLSYLQLVQYALGKLENRVLAQEKMISEQSFKNNVNKLSETKTEENH